MNYIYFDKDGTPVTVDQFSPEGKKRFLELWDEDYRRVGLDNIGDVRISTVFIPINMSMGSTPPVIFETMVFEYPNEDDVEFQWRYFTEEAARAGHAKVVQAVRDRTLSPCTLDWLS